MAKKEFKFNEFEYKDCSKEDFAQLVMKELPINLVNSEELINRICYRYQAIPKDVVIKYVIQILETMRYILLTGDSISILNFMTNMHFHSNIHIFMNKKRGYCTIRGKLSKFLKDSNISHVLAARKEDRIQKTIERNRKHSEWVAKWNAYMAAKLQFELDLELMLRNLESNERKI